jgi:UDP-N-acetylglucosamine--dolichyl-phosphate N-acetylglucosaminephosphotransferase
MEKILILPILLSFFITLFSLPLWVKRAKKAGLTGEDMNKNYKEYIAEAGGVVVILAFVLGILSYVAIKTFYFKTTENIIEIFVMLISLLLIAFVAFTDDILGWKIGLNKKIRIILMFFAALPLMVINAGESVMMGINFGILYPLFFIPLGIIGASTTYNFLAGYNGLEASQGAIILSGMGIITFLTGNSWLSVICLSMVICLIAFLFWNWTPAKVLPGDVLTYSLGGLIAIISILGNVEKIAIFFFIPYIIETGLKLRGGLKKESFAKVNSDGSLNVPYEKIYGLEHLAIKILKKMKNNQKVREQEVVLTINLFQIVIIILGILIFI